MNEIEKRARELLAAQYRAANISDDFVSRCIEGDAMLTNQERMAVDAIRAALLLRRPVDLLDHDGASRIEAQELQVVPSAALGADEAGAVGIDQVAGGLPRNVQLAEVASEHKAGVRPEGDGEATADHSEHSLEMVERVAKAMQEAEQGKMGWTWQDCSPIEVEGWTDLARAAIAALTRPEGFVLVPVEPTDDMVWAPSDVEVGYPTWAGSRDGCTTDEAKAIWAAMLAARPEVPRG